MARRASSRSDVVSPLSRAKTTSTPRSASTASNVRCAGLPAPMPMTSRASGWDGVRDRDWTRAAGVRSPIDYLDSRGLPSAPNAPLISSGLNADSDPAVYRLAQDCFRYTSQALPMYLAS